MRAEMWVDTDSKLWFLNEEEIQKRLSLLKGDNRKAILLCLATGGRWGDTLQRISGHANIQQTMTYAHFAHDLLEDAVTLNQIAGRSL